MQKREFENFIKIHFNTRYNMIMRTFEKYLEILTEENKKVNLVSRKTSVNDFWNIHFLDSILPVAYVNFYKKKILDFGSGGGLPGLPIKIVIPDTIVYLLDSRQKKVNILKKIIKKLDLKDCFTIVSRLENLNKEWENYFDVIICRSVKILPAYKDKMMKLLKKDGKIMLYKSKKLDDISLFETKEIIDISHPSIGFRRLVIIKNKI
jgi:16S rRNA (guanine527-N7)-methyltransferase